MSTDRDTFESFQDDKTKSTGIWRTNRRDNEGQYTHDGMQNDWSVWQAATAAAERQVALLDIEAAVNKAFDSARGRDGIALGFNGNGLHAVIPPKGRIVRGPARPNSMQFDSEWQNWVADLLQWIKEVRP